MIEIELPQNGKPIVPPRLGFAAVELGLDMVEDLKSLKRPRGEKRSHQSQGRMGADAPLSWLTPYISYHLCNAGARRKMRPRKLTYLALGSKSWTT